MVRFAKCTGILAVTLAIGAWGTGAVEAQGFPTGGGTTGGGGGTGDLGVAVPDLTVGPGETFTVSVHIDEPQPIDFLTFFMNTDPMGVQFLAWTPGAGLQAYLDANLPPPQCDVFVDPMSFMGLMMMLPPYESATYPTERSLHDLAEFYRITAVANGAAGTTTSLDWFADSMVGIASGAATITIGEPAETLMRGDVDGDLNCNITDAVNLLGYLFTGTFTPNCLDASDVDDDGTVGIADAVNLLSGLFGTGFVLEDTCQEDVTPDSLGTCDRDSCL